MSMIEKDTATHTVTIRTAVWEVVTADVAISGGMDPDEWVSDNEADILTDAFEKKVGTTIGQDGYVDFLDHEIEVQPIASTRKYVVSDISEVEGRCDRW